MSERFFLCYSGTFSDKLIWRLHPKSDMKTLFFCIYVSPVVTDHQSNSLGGKMVRYVRTEEGARESRESYNNHS